MALEMCAELKSMGSSLVSIKEMEGTEALANLCARQDKVIQWLMIEMKNTAKEADASIDVLLEARKAQVARLEYYLTLTGSTVLDIAASVIMIISDINEAAETLGVGVSIDPVTKNMEMCERVIQLQQQQADYTRDTEA
ncbi:uncharacterized protein ATNIH1004_011754 [Aspergillus tanneri]|uniref:Uncharacterized protein n=1 Tax=Aspergillus tanneri TaxID=1220188 RepID=A0A5M9M4D2_9EURO|nr:uncharacterized protein ATNIH1004_011754 [Aspergillus tanneri]KAA8641618.1 hypothetical protein ATNIH1004_011754 [Aspergillus tanneri]